MSYCEQCAALLRQNDFLANDRDGYVQLLTDENNKLRAQVNTAAEMLREVKARNTDLRAEVEKLRAALHEAADELDAYYRAEYPGDHPYSKRKLADAMRDNPARIALKGK